MSLGPVRRACFLALLLLPLVPGAAPQAAPSGPIVVAVLDSGIDPDHPEFAPGQIVAWRDFVGDGAAPYDDHGHGTATASLVAGQNRAGCADGTPKQAYAPDARLVIAKVANAEGSITGDVDAAIRWSVEQGADVISMSFGTIVPFPVRTLDEIQRARAAGVLVVVAAGNGAGNAGLAPMPSWLTNHGNDPYALVVGGGTRTGTLLSTTGNLDPEVTSWSDGVCVAKAGGGYRLMSGTSFSAPLVSGMAAKAIAAARAAGQPDGPDRIEPLILHSARNNVFSPYAREGLGHLMDAELALLVHRAQSGTPLSQAVAEYDAQGAHARADRQFHAIVPILQRAQPG